MMDDTERRRRWRLVLGGGDADGVSDSGGTPLNLSALDRRMDSALGGLYDAYATTRG
ncbi:hypothetical protein IHN63_17375, partial [Deinococcus sp. 6YEL10]|nr:hypothetical protein [Deinococcus sp. 6YEL10]